MIPIITDDVECEKLSIYNASVLPKNPLNGARLKNTTGKHLLQGPITVLDGNSYAGDARIDNVPPGQERLLSYGIDLQMTVDSTKNTQEDHIQTGKIVKGVLTITRKVCLQPGLRRRQQIRSRQDADRRASDPPGLEAGRYRKSRSRPPIRSIASKARSRPTKPAR